MSLTGISDLIKSIKEGIALCSIAMSRAYGIPLIKASKTSTFRNIKRCRLK